MSVEESQHCTLLQCLVRGIPPKAEVADVLTFFRGLDIDESSVKLNFRERRGAGEVRNILHFLIMNVLLLIQEFLVSLKYQASKLLSHLSLQAIVTFKTQEDIQKALSKDREFFCESKFGSRFVRVVPFSDDTTTAHLSSEDQTISGDMHKEQNLLEKSKSFAVAPCAPSVFSNPGQTTPLPAPPTLSSLNNHSAIKIEGLPPNITIAEIVQLFWGTPAKAGSTVVRKDPRIPHEAHAYMDLGAPEHALHAVVTWNGTVMTTSSGIFTIKVSLASHLEYKTAANAIASAEKEKSNSEQDAAVVVVKMRGLPVKASLQDILTFFEGYTIKKQNQANNAPAVHIQPVVGENRHSKKAYVEFESAAEATRASVEKNQTLFGKKAFGDRYCILQKISRQEMMAEIARNNVNTAATTTTTTTGGAAPVHSNKKTSLSNGSFDFTTSCASPAAFLNSMQYPGTAAAAAPPFMMPALPYPQLPWGVVPPSSYVYPQMQFANIMQQQQQPYFAGFPTQQQQQQQQMWPQQHAAPPAMQQPAGSGARYLVQDLSTGQKVYLDPRFNLYTGGGAGGVFPSSGAATGMFPPSGMMPPPATAAAPLVSDRDAHAQEVPQAPSGWNNKKATAAAAATLRSMAAVPSLPCQQQPENESSHHTTTETQMVGGEDVAAEQGSNEGSDQEQPCELPALAAVAAAVVAEGDKGSDQGSEDGAGVGNRVFQEHHHHHHNHSHHHHRHAADNNDKVSGAAAVIVAPPNHPTTPKDGHKRLSMELNLPEDDRPVKHSHAEGH
jgi:RNA recognition motif-containing protein